ncbi:protein kinase [Streptomyces silvensis]|uniref:Protein kinase n=1 Tax=Streptomyces silvensis TaxID=1765722 RepID=A0A0W7WXR7_9ACTN|nr:protein kinase [Streptomyces silvensis]KUF15303.1 protein kinase [Streptomyces silvensis]
MPVPETPSIPAAILAILNPTDSRIVLDRRGSTVWHVRCGQARYAVKLGYPIPATEHWDGADWTALAPAREGVVLQELGSTTATYGVWAQGTWNVQPWHPGTDLQSRWTPHRTRHAPSRPPLPDVLACADALGELHDKGYAHGDVQPAHFILSDGDGPVQAALIDLALVGGAAIPARFDFPYRGCLVHYEAPEIARRVLESGEATPTREADVYGLGATLFMAATGWRHVEYPDDAPRTAQRRAVVDRSHRPVNIAGPLGRLVDDMLRPDPRDRPTMREVRGTLASETR